MLLSGSVLGVTNYKACLGSNGSGTTSHPDLFWNGLTKTNTNFKVRKLDRADAAGPRPQYRNQARFL